MIKFFHLIFISFCLIFSCSKAISQTFYITGRATEGIKGNVVSITTDKGKAIEFDKYGNILSFNDKYRAYTYSYTDLFHYVTGYEIAMEISFPDDHTRIEKGFYPDGNEIIYTYLFDNKGKINKIVLDEIYSFLQIEYKYDEEGEFPVQMKVDYSNEAGEWKDLYKYDYWSFDYTGNWIQRSVTVSSIEGENHTEESYNEIASYVYLDTEEEQEDPNFFSYTFDSISTFDEGIFTSFDDHFQFGWTMFFLIPKENPTTWYNHQIEKIPNSVGDEWKKMQQLEKDLSGLTFKELAAEFDIYVYYIAKKDLYYFPLGDARYTGANSRTDYGLWLDYDTQTIFRIEEFEIKSSDDYRLWPWLEQLLEDKRKGL